MLKFRRVNTWWRLDDTCLVESYGRLGDIFAKTPQVVLIDDQYPAALVTFEMFASQQTLDVCIPTNIRGKLPRPLVKSVIQFPSIGILLTAGKGNKSGMKPKDGSWKYQLHLDVLSRIEWVFDSTWQRRKPEGILKALGVEQKKGGFWSECIRFFCRFLVWQLNIVMLYIWV